MTATNDELSAKVIFALPAYNEAKNLTPLIEETDKVFAQQNLKWQAVIVDDASTDETPEILKALQLKFPVESVRHAQNQGLGGAIKTAIHEALKRTTSDNDIIVTMDADNTHSPDFAPKMAQRIWRENFDVVIASRFCDGSAEVGVPFARRLLSRAARMMFRLFLNMKNVTDYTCGYRAFRSTTLQKAIDKYGDKIIVRNGFACTDELLVKIATVTSKISEIPFTLRYDLKQGKSKLPLFRTIYETLKLLILKR
ncbi:glycosyltransferase [Candidatus Sumerlaeota bacterium]|nr:glycosyltransferase [Candidatus Sumerlaeota bacterium]